MFLCQKKTHVSAARLPQMSLCVQRSTVVHISDITAEVFGEEAATQ